MIGDAKVTITVEELDNLREADDRWRKHHSEVYREKVANLKEREELLAKNEATLENKVGDYLIASKYSGLVQRYYYWERGSTLFHAFEKEKDLFFEDAVTQFLKTHSIFDIWLKKREIEK